MWPLTQHTPKQEAAYVDKVYVFILKRIEAITRQANTPPPAPKPGKRRKTRVKHLKKSLVTKFSSKDFVRELVLKQPDQMPAFETHFGADSKHTDLERILDYTLFTSSKAHANGASFLANIKAVRTCPYCNRAFTMVVNDKSQYTLRPDFDHWLTQSAHPLFALSLYNIVPTCLNCNRTIKNATGFDPAQHINPYDRTASFHFRFTFLPHSHDGYDIDIHYTGSDPRMALTHQELKLSQLYARSHSDYEVRDLVVLFQKYGGRYMEELIAEVGKELHLTREEAFRHLLGLETDPRRDLDRPLNKLRRDIVTELSKYVK